MYDGKIDTNNWLSSRILINNQRQRRHNILWGFSSDEQFLRWLEASILIAFYLPRSETLTSIRQLIFAPLFCPLKQWRISVDESFSQKYISRLTAQRAINCRRKRPWPAQLHPERRKKRSLCKSEIHYFPIDGNLGSEGLVKGLRRVSRQT